MNNLLPCPFCGGEPICYIGICEQTKNPASPYIIMCKWCSAAISNRTKDSVASAWNKRDCEPTTKEIVPYELFEKAEELTNALKKLTIKPTK